MCLNTIFSPAAFESKMKNFQKKIATHTALQHMLQNWCISEFEKRIVVDGFRRKKIIIFIIDFSNI